MALTFNVVQVVSKMQNLSTSLQDANPDVIPCSFSQHEVSYLPILTHLQYQPIALAKPSIFAQFISIKLFSLVFSHGSRRWKLGISLLFSFHHALQGPHINH